MPRGPEYRFQSLVRGALDQRRPHTWHFKAHGSVFQAGIPDLVGCDAAHGAFAWELKATERGQVDWSEVSELQRHTLRLIAAAGGQARVLFYHERLRVVLSPDAARVPPSGTKWSEAGILAFAIGGDPVPGAAASTATSLAYAEDAQGGIAWDVQDRGEGWRVARLHPTTRGLPLACVLSLGFGTARRRPDLARERADTA
jgi:hypothetical protein